METIIKCNGSQAIIAYDFDNSGIIDDMLAHGVFTPARDEFGETIYCTSDQDNFKIWQNFANALAIFEARHGSPLSIKWGFDEETRTGFNEWLFNFINDFGAAYARGINAEAEFITKAQEK